MNGGGRGTGRALRLWADRGEARLFTLVETLVVMAILAILVSIMLPALSMMREQGYHVVCKNQLHQMGTALLAYTDDFDGDLPPWHWNELAYNRWNGTNASYYLYNDVVGAGSLDSPRWWVNHGTLYILKYITDPRNFYCPSLKGKNLELATYSPFPATPPLSLPRLSIRGGYYYNPHVRESGVEVQSGAVVLNGKTFDNRWLFNNVRDLRPDKILMLDALYTHVNANNRADSHLYPLPAWNLLMGDGHVTATESWSVYVDKGTYAADGFSSANHWSFYAALLKLENGMP